jgi:regulation of enolase protein 1 (concanavalin A-like superfamily)
VDQAVDAITSQASPRWLRLVRQGNVFRSFDSADGENWEWLGTDSLDLPSKTFVGLAITSHDAGQLCSAVVEQTSVTLPKLPLSTTGKVGRGDGLQGTYFPTMGLTGKSIQRVDPTVNFDWGWGAPADGIGYNNFSVRWEGELEAQFTEPYAIQIVSDDRARVWLNGDLLIDEWYEHAEQASTALVNLEAGKHYLIRIDYFENRGRAVARVLWSSPSTPQQIIPQSQLYSRIANQNGDGLPDLWKLAHGLNPTDRAGADQIVKGTGLTARQLYVSGFEPSAPVKQVGAWLSQDIGRVGVDGSAVLSGDAWTLQGSGADIWANVDGFQFVYQPWRGDAQIVARVLSQDNTDPWAKAGLMVRTSLRPDAAHLMLAATVQNGLSLIKREQDNQSATAQSAASPAAQPWLKLMRHGTVVNAFTSSDGVNWSWIDTQILNGDDPFYIGLAVGSHDNSKLGTATFDQVSIDKPEPDQPVSLSQGSGDGMAATYFDGSTGRSVNRVDSTVDFDWDIDSPMPGIGPAHFSVRWEASLEPQSSELYALHLLSDDGARLWMDDQLLIDAWTDHGPVEETVTVALEAGRLYAIRLEYFQRTGEAICKLLWSSPTIPKQPIPQSQLYSGPAPIITTYPQVSPGSIVLADSASSLSPKTTAIGKTSGHPSTGRLTPTITGVRNVDAVVGANPMAHLGRWEVDGSSIYAVDRRGWLEYRLTAPTADVFRIEILGASHNQVDPDPGFYLLVSVDGEYLGRLLLDAGFGRLGTVQVLTP